MKHQVRTTGYSLIEVLVSIAVLLLAIVGPMTIASQGIKSSAFAIEQNTAFMHAQEGIEAVFALRNNAALDSIDSGSDSWQWFSDLYSSGPCNDGRAVGTACSFGIDFRSDTVENNITSNLCESDPENCRLYEDESGTRAAYTHVSSGEPTQFTRIITVEEKESYAVEVRSTVTWESQVFGGAKQDITLTTVVFDTTL